MDRWEGAGEGGSDFADVADIVEVEQLLARYATGMTRDDIDAVVEVFTADGTYSAFGDTYSLADFPELVAAAPKGLFLTGTPALDLDAEAGTGTGVQTLCFVDQTTHRMRIGWYSDTYRRTLDGWRLHTRSMTFLRRSGARDAGRPHDPTRPEPTRAAVLAPEDGRMHPSSGASTRSGPEG
jgi:SnoaL-like domain